LRPTAFVLVVLMYGVARDVTERRRTAAEQDALRRIATLAAQDARPQELFAVVAEEVARVVDLPLVRVMRYEPDDTATECASFSTDGRNAAFGSRSSLEGTNVLRLVRETSKPARIDDFSGLEGELAEIARSQGIRSSVGSPILVAGRLWGAMVASSTEQLPQDTEQRLADFIELLATATANAESREALERLAEEQAALRRVAELVAREAAPAEVFAAIAEEVGHLLEGRELRILRYEGDTAVVVGASGGRVQAFPVGFRVPLGGDNTITRVFNTGKPARVADYRTATGPVSELAKGAGARNTLAVPVLVEARTWGAIVTGSETDEEVPPDAESRLEQFTELMATAISNAAARAEVERLADEQAALRRVATLVAQGVRPDEVFSAVSEEIGRLFGTNTAGVTRFDHDGPTLVFVGVSKHVEAVIPIGTRWQLDDALASAEVYRTGRSARADAVDWSAISGPVGPAGRRLGAVSTVASPIIVEGCLWGTATVSASEPLPADADDRLEKFTELLATAIANAESSAELAASRRRIVAASDDARRRIERDLHDGVQQQLVSIGLELAVLEADAPAGDARKEQLASVTEHVGSALEALVEIARGIHPAILAHGGLAAALKGLARRSAVLVELHAQIDDPLPDEVEVAAYYVAAEALTNVAKYACASVVHMDVATDDGTLRLMVRDDGVGGAELGKGTGLVGLQDRVEALGGTIAIDSPPGEGTRVAITLPIAAEPDPEQE
jgi:signal transduction histidine kinase